MLKVPCFSGFIVTLCHSVPDARYPLQYVNCDAVEAVFTKTISEHLEVVPFHPFANFDHNIFIELVDGRHGFESGLCVFARSVAFSATTATTQ